MVQLHLPPKPHNPQEPNSSNGLRANSTPLAEAGPHLDVVEARHLQLVLLVLLAPALAALDQGLPAVGVGHGAGGVGFGVGALATASVGYSPEGRLLSAGALLLCRLGV